MVVSINERIVYSKGPYQYDSKRGSGVIPKACPLEPVNSNGDDYYYDSRDLDNFDNCYVGGNPPPPSGGGSTPKPSSTSKSFPCGDSDRASNNNRDRVSFRRFKNIDRWRDANEWFDGEHEMQVSISFRNSGGGPTTLKKTWFGSSDDLRSCNWLTCDVDNFNGEFQEVITWLPDAAGNMMKYSWLEVDSGTPITLSFKLSPKVKFANIAEVQAFEVGFSITISNKSDDLGEHIVEYCNSTNPRSEYDTGWVIFHVDQQP